MKSFVDQTKNLGFSPKNDKVPLNRFNPGNA